jgi:hypothetical protein
VKKEIAAEAYTQAYKWARADIGAENLTSSYRLICAIDPAHTHKSLWYAPYNVLLNAHFPTSAGFAILPQWETDNPCGSIDYVVHSPFVTYIIELKMKPIFFVEIKLQCHHSKKWARCRFAYYKSKYRGLHSAKL